MRLTASPAPRQSLSVPEFQKQPAISASILQFSIGSATKLTHPDSGIEIAHAKVFGVVGAPDEWYKA
jgi:hypothetical protein